MVGNLVFNRTVWIRYSGNVIKKNVNIWPLFCTSQLTIEFFPAGAPWQMGCNLINETNKSDEMVTARSRHHELSSMWQYMIFFNPNLVGDEIGSIWIILRQSVSWSHFCWSHIISTITWAVFNTGSPNLVQRYPSVIFRSSLKMGHVDLFLDLKIRSPKMHV